MKTTDQIVSETIKRLQDLTGEDFHGYRCEIWGVIFAAMKEQDSNTRHACAEKCLSVVTADHLKIVGQAFHDACLNTVAI